MDVVDGDIFLQLYHERKYTTRLMFMDVIQSPIFSCSYLECMLQHVEVVCGRGRHSLGWFNRTPRTPPGYGPVSISADVLVSCTAHNMIQCIGIGTKGGGEGGTRGAPGAVPPPPPPNFC